MMAVNMLTNALLINRYLSFLFKKDLGCTPGGISLGFSSKIMCTPSTAHPKSGRLYFLKFSAEFVLKISSEGK